MLKDIAVGAIRKVTARGSALDITFGTSKVNKEGWDGLFPVIAQKVVVKDGKELRPCGSWYRGRSNKRSTLARLVKRVGRGYSFGTTDQWVELLTHPDRVKS